MILLALENPCLRKIKENTMESSKQILLQEKYHPRNSWHKLSFYHWAFWQSNGLQEWKVHIKRGEEEKQCSEKSIWEYKNSDYNDPTMITNKIMQFIQRKRNSRDHKSGREYRRESSVSEFSNKKSVCYKCNKHEHIKPNCQKIKSKKAAHQVN